MHGSAAKGRAAAAAAAERGSIGPGARSRAAEHGAPPPTPPAPCRACLDNVPQILHNQAQRAFRGAHAAQHVHHLAGEAAPLADLRAHGGQGRRLGGARVSPDSLPSQGTCDNSNSSSKFRPFHKKIVLVNCSFIPVFCWKQAACCTRLPSGWGPPDKVKQSLHSPGGAGALGLSAQTWVGAFSRCHETGGAAQEVQRRRTRTNTRTHLVGALERVGGGGHEEVQQALGLELGIQLHLAAGGGSGRLCCESRGEEGPGGRRGSRATRGKRRAAGWRACAVRAGGQVD